MQLLTEKGFSYVMLHSSNATVRRIPCTGMNETHLLAAAPDLQRPMRAYGVSSKGELIGLALSGQNRVTSCRVRLRQEVRATLPAPSMAVIQAGAVVTGAESLQFFNTTSSAKGLSRIILQQQLSQILRFASLFLFVIFVFETCMAAPQRRASQGGSGSLSPYLLISMHPQDQQSVGHLAICAVVWLCSDDHHVVSTLYWSHVQCFPVRMVHAGALVSQMCLS